MSTPRNNSASHSDALSKTTEVYLPIEVEGIPYNITTDRIGKGNFGSVNIVVPADDNNALSKQLCAKIQILFLSKQPEKKVVEIESFNRKVNTELEVLKALKRGFGDVIQKSHSATKKEKIIIMEYFPGVPLDDLEGLSFQQLRHIMFGSIQEVITLHTLTPKRYFHGDIRSGNFLYNANTGEVRLIDFGNASSSIHEKSDPGAMAFLAPERRKEGQDYSTEKTDVYSLAITFAELFKFGEQKGEYALVMRFAWKEWDEVAHEVNESEQAEKKLFYYYFRYVMAADKPEDRPTATQALHILQNPVELKKAVGAFMDLESKQVVDVLIDPNHPKSELKNTNDEDTRTIPESTTLFTLDSSALDSNSNQYPERSNSKLDSIETETETETDKDTAISSEKLTQLEQWGKKTSEAKTNKVKLTSQKLQGLGFNKLPTSHDEENKLTEVISIIEFYFREIATHRLSEEHGKTFEAKWRPQLRDIQSAKGPEKSQKLVAYLKELISFFNKQCQIYAQPHSLGAFFKKIINENEKPKLLNPILELNAHSTKHHLTRGAGSVLKYLASNAELQEFLEEKFDLNIVEALKQASCDWRGKLEFDLNELNPNTVSTPQKGLSQ